MPKKIPPHKRPGQNWPADHVERRKVKDLMKTKPSYKPTPEQRAQVDAMAAYGVPEHAIARVLKIDPKTLRKHFREELDIAHIKANSAVAQSLFRKATGDGPQSVTACIFWLKVRMGWKETEAIEHSGPGGGPIQTEESSSRAEITRRIAGLIARKEEDGDPE